MRSRWLSFYARFARRIPILFFHPQKIALIESMNPQWQDVSEA